jgi:hypothetical protein
MGAAATCCMFDGTLAGRLDSYPASSCANWLVEFWNGDEKGPRFRARLFKQDSLPTLWSIYTIRQMR